MARVFSLQNDLYWLNLLHNYFYKKYGKKNERSDFGGGGWNKALS